MLGGLARSGSLGSRVCVRAAHAVTRFAFEDLGLTRLKAGRAYDNPASGRVLAKLGFTPRHGSAFSRPRGEKIAQRHYISLLPRLNSWLSVRARKLCPVNGLDRRAQGAIVLAIPPASVPSPFAAAGAHTALKGAPVIKSSAMTLSPSLVAASRELDPSMDLRLADAAALPLDDASAGPGDRLHVASRHRPDARRHAGSRASSRTARSQLRLAIVHPIDSSRHFEANTANSATS